VFETVNRGYAYLDQAYRILQLTHT